MTERVMRDPQASESLAEHQALMRKIEEIRTFWREVCEQGVGPLCSEMADRVGEIRQLLVDHFASEEDGGYLGKVLELAPHFSEQAEELCAQHAAFLRALQDLETRLRKPEFADWDSASSEFETLIHDLEDHEHQENNIVQSAFNQDVGAGD